VAAGVAGDVAALEASRLRIPAGPRSACSSLSTDSIVAARSAGTMPAMSGTRPLYERMAIGSPSGATSV
jgi:hypothetical protein